MTSQKAQTHACEVSDLETEGKILPLRFLSERQIVLLKPQGNARKRMVNK
jgi:aromatic ring-opening dioxygenase LigB subunit